LEFKRFCLYVNIT